MPGLANVLIVDDHQHSIDKLLDLLKIHKNIKILDTAKNAGDAFEKIQKYTPDLVFLDIEMPDKSGFKLLEDLTENKIPVPEVIFTTGFNDYAIKALQNRALDYLLKPIARDDLDAAILRYFNKLNEKHRQNNVLAINDLIKQLSVNDRIFIPTVTGYKNIRVSDILFIKRIGELSARVFIYYDANQFDSIPVCYSLRQVFEMMPGQNFFQIDRNVIINIDYLKEVEVKGRCCILEKNGIKTILTISRQRLKEFKMRFCPGEGMD